MLIINKSTVFPQTAKYPINHIIGWVVPDHFEDCLRPAGVRMDFFCSSLAQMPQKLKPMGAVSGDLGLYSSGANNLSANRRRDTASYILTYGKIRCLGGPS